MSWIQSVVLGVVQGLTEFLPVSSSAHLVLFQHFLNVIQDSLVFDIALHLGTLLAVFVFYRKPLHEITIIFFQDLFKRKWNSPSVRLIFLVLVASLPTGFMGFLLKDTFESLFLNLTAIGCALIITGTLLYATKKWAQGEDTRDFFDLKFVSSMTYLQAFLIGVTQGFAITPGISRSGSTIATGIFLKLPWTASAFFSFLLSIPAILGAALLQIKELDSFSVDPFVLFIGVTSSFIFGLLGLNLIFKFVKKGRLFLFSYYLWFLGLGILIYQFFLN